MQHYISNSRRYILAHWLEFMIGTIAVIVVGTIVALFIYNRPHDDQPKLAYQPVDACKLFTEAEAQSLLGEKIISLNTVKPVLSGDVTTSKCSYTDTNPSQNQMRVAALAVRAGISDQGIKQTRDDFATARPTQNIQAVPNLGDEAYFNPTLGQLNILDGRTWLIISYGIGLMPETNTLEDATALAHKVLPAHKKN